MSLYEIGCYVESFRVIKISGLFGDYFDVWMFGDFFVEFFIMVMGS